MYESTEDITEILDPMYDLHKNNLQAYPILIGFCAGLQCNTIPDSPAWNLLKEIVQKLALGVMSPAANQLQSFTVLVKSFSSDHSNET